ncbi:MAG TPA: inorganic phosphate transporter [Thermoprotei archaeon]|nr:inorganic phosphate transporter [Thermoprotei archaeon]
MEPLLLASFLVAFYIAWSIGANDETMATLAGSGMVSVALAALIGAIMDFLGAVFMGYMVEETIGRGLIVREVGIADTFIILLAVATWLVVASYRGWPISTTHSTVGAAIGLGIYKYGFTGVQWSSLLKVIASWILSPLTGLLGAIAVYYVSRKVYLRKIRGLKSLLKVSKYSTLLLAVWTSYTAFFRGANDIANATGFLSYVSGSPLLTRLICGAGLALGLLILGRRVIKSVGVQLVELDPFTALCAQVSVAVTMCVGTLLALPLSGTHVLVSAVLGIGVAKKTWINIRGVEEIVATWVLTFPCSALLSALLTALAEQIGLL